MLAKGERPQRVGGAELVGIEIEQRRALGVGAGEVVIRHGRRPSWLVL